MAGSDTVNATINSFVILREITKRDGATLDTLEQHLPYSRSTIYSHLNTLNELGVVTKVNATYHVGLGILQFAGQARSRYHPYLIGRTEMNELSTEYEVLVQVAFMEDERCIYIYQTGDQFIDVPQPQLGTRVDFHSSATGKAILSTLSDESQRQLVEERDLERYTPNTIIDPERLAAELEEISSTKIAFDFEEQFEGINCISTPVAFGNGLIGALSMSVPSTETDESYLRGELADEVHKTGRIIEMDAEYKNWQ